MKLSYIRASFDTFSGKVSDLTRQLGLAGIAIIWIFKIDNKTGLTLPKELYLPLVSFCAGLLIDLLQYLYGAVAWGLILGTSKKTKDNDEIKVAEWINIPTWVFFVIKVLACLFAYVLLLLFVIHKI